MCMQLAAPGCGAWHPRAAALTLAKGTPLQALGHRYLLVRSEKAAPQNPASYTDRHMLSVTRQQDGTVSLTQQ